LLYVLALLIFCSSLKFSNILEVIPEKLIKTSSLVLSIYSAWVISTIYMDIYLWYFRKLRKDHKAVELMIHTKTELGREDIPVVGKHKWLLAYPGYLILSALGWYYLIYPPTNLH